MYTGITRNVSVTGYYDPSPVGGYDATITSNHYGVRYEG